MDFNQEQIIKQVSELAEPLIISCGIQLIDIKLASHRKNHLIRIIINKSDGVTIDDCTKIAKELDILLEVHNIIDNYRLEVSSPGLNYPLKKTEDYKHFTGYLIKIILHKDIKGKKQFVGILEGLEDENVILEVNNKNINIPLSQISKAHLEVDWSKEFKNK